MKENFSWRSRKRWWKTSLPWMSILPNGIPTSARKQNSSATRASRAVWSSVRTAMPSGNTSRAFLTVISRRPDTRTSTCRCSFRRASSTKRRTTSKASRPSAPGSPSAAVSSSKSACASVRHPRPCSATTGRTSSNPTATCRNSITSGSASCAGRRPPVRSCVPVNSCGRRAIPCTPRQRKPPKRPSAC